MDLLLVGVGGYGEYYMQMLTESVLKDGVRLVGAVDPYAEKSSWFGYFAQHGIPVYKDIKDFYAVRGADLAMIATPINLHKDQTVYCLSQGSNVLCEKPICGNIADALAMKDAAAKYGKKLGIGFQWSFADSMNALKADIARGVYGAPLFFKSCISWRRDADYYGKSPWKGRRKSASGEDVNDCIITNATAHYLHNMFFITDSRAVSYKAVCKRGYDIETFDTCAISGKTDKGFDFLFEATHVGERTIDPLVEYRFEKGSVFFDGGSADMLYAVTEDGRRVEYGAVQGNVPSAGKILHMIEAAEGKGKPRCTVDTVLPHLTLSLDIIENVKAAPFAHTRKDGAFTVADGICDIFERCYEEERFPEELESM